MKKRLLAVLLAAVMTAAMLPTAFAASSGVCGDDAAWTLDDSGKLTISGTGAVEQTDETVAAWTNVKTVEVGYGITELGPAVFKLGGTITKVTLPETLTDIDEGAFYLEGSLKEINIPNSVEWIDDGAFFGCVSLTELTLPDELTAIGDMAFLGVNVPSVTVPESVDWIGEQALGYRLTDAFEAEAIPGFTIYGYTDSEAEAYAEDNGFAFVALDGGNTDPDDDDDDGDDEITFTDVTPGIWYEEAVRYAVENELMSGVGGDKFSPNTTASRVQILTILARQAGEVIEGANWEKDAVAWAVENEVSDGTNPGGNINREQLAVMLWRYEGEPDVEDASVLDDYPDVSSVSSWAVDGMAWAVENGIITGADGRLAPGTNASRAQVAIILMRYCEM